MALDATHPLYDENIEDQTLMRDAYKGERHIKEKDITYLFPTPGMVLDGMNPGQEGRANYNSYKGRAVFPDYVSEAVEALIGLLHQNPAVIEVPKVMEPMLERATADGEGAQGLLRRINEQQLVTGRVGALLDLPLVPDPANPLPFIALYDSESIRNWDSSEDVQGTNKLTMVVLDESCLRRVQGEFNWEVETRYRVLEIIDGKYASAVFAKQTNYDPSLMAQPIIRGAALEEIPFVFINSKDILPTPDNPPLLGVARLSLTVYRGEADYRQGLFMQGQDTLVVIGGVRQTTGEETTRVGAGAKLDVEMGGDAKYIGVSGQGLPEQRTALENDRKEAKSKTGQLVDSMGSKQESGEALKTRLGAQTATLNQIAKTSAAALEKLLKIAAKWLGADPDQVTVTPNLEFADMSIDGKDFVDLMTAKNMGLPLSKQSIHELLQERGLTQMEFEDEMSIIEEEDPLSGTLAGGLAALPPPVDPNRVPADPNADPNAPPKPAVKPTAKPAAKK